MIVQGLPEDAHTDMHIQQGQPVCHVDLHKTQHVNDTEEGLMDASPCDDLLQMRDVDKLELEGARQLAYP